MWQVKQDSKVCRLTNHGITFMKIYWLTPIQSASLAIFTLCHSELNVAKKL